jgi:hypothetical protein
MMLAVSRLGVLLSMTALLASAAAHDSSAAQMGIARFQMPSRNIGCGFVPASSSSPAYLRCDILSGLRPVPRRHCMLDWTGLLLGTSTRGQANCAGDTIYSRSAATLRYGQTWRRGPFSCTSRRTGVTCRSAAGHGFFLTRGRWRVF